MQRGIRGGGGSSEGFSFLVIVKLFKRGQKNGGGTGWLKTPAFFYVNAYTFIHPDVGDDFIS